MDAEWTHFYSAPVNHVSAICRSSQTPQLQIDSQGEQIKSHAITTINIRNAGIVTHL